jgi:hypothetical protein
LETVKVSSILRLGRHVWKSLSACYERLYLISGGEFFPVIKLRRSREHTEEI